MKTHEIDDALAQVRSIQELILDREYFHGYSGLARMAAGMAALAGMLALVSGRVSPDPLSHLRVWAVVMAIGLLPGMHFLNPWPMGLVFFAGETLGGWILIKNSTSQTNEETS